MNRAPSPAEQLGQSDDDRIALYGHSHSHAHSLNQAAKSILEGYPPRHSSARKDGGEAAFCHQTGAGTEVRSAVCALIGALCTLLAWRGRWSAGAASFSRYGNWDGWPCHGYQFKILVLPSVTALLTRRRSAGYTRYKKYHTCVCMLQIRRLESH